MKIQQRAYSGQADLEAMAALVRACPADHVHGADLPYRLSSWALDDPENVGLWVNAEGQLLAWAVLQAPFWMIDYAYHCNADQALRQQLMVWADRRARQAAGTVHERPRWYMTAFAGQADLIRDLEEAEFASQANIGPDSWSQVLMRCPAQTPITDHPLPAGFAIRPLAGESEVQAYVELHQAVFESRNMTVEWRARTLHRPEYIPDLDLIAVLPDGHLAAFCICWLDRNAGETSGRIEPLGVRQDLRKLGLGQALLSEGLRQLRRRGAGKIDVHTDNDRQAALRLYESVGFRVVQDILMYRKDYL